jgi:hypothetical protein
LLKEIQIIFSQYIKITNMYPIFIILLTITKLLKS